MKQTTSVLSIFLILHAFKSYQDILLCDKDIQSYELVAQVH